MVNICATDRILQIPKESRKNAGLREIFSGETVQDVTNRLLFATVGLEFRGKMQLGLSPERFKPLGPPTGKLVIFVADGVFLIKILVIFFCREEFRSLGHFRDDGSPESLGAFYSVFGLFRCLPLLVALIENDGPILVAVVAELRVRGDRIDIMPKSFEQLRIREL